MLLQIIAIIVSTAAAQPTTQPCVDAATWTRSCPDTAVLDSLAAEIGDGSALTPELVRRLRRSARRLAVHSTCAHVRDSAEELAFDLTAWLEQEASR